ncbi:Zn-dependent hydrolase, RNA-metabolising [Helicobacter heilmannii]|uniref:ribonuclease J n=1 Tax=Helicobacter heilmannii TaxID=35817 RepID=UPI0006A0644A|nr:ribonuclease J [Helicobacter heilmannii]CRF48133.1 Zn-dependent hydrolase, RNA-metabolising [Helicobacter heilmannii]
MENNPFKDNPAEGHHENKQNHQNHQNETPPNEHKETQEPPQGHAPQNHKKPHKNRFNNRIKQGRGALSKNNNPQQEQSGAKSITKANERGNLGFHKELKQGVEANHKIHINHLNPHYKLDLNVKARVKITPLGGLGEIGGNMMVIETMNQAIIIDVGMSFPSEDMYGVDILIPDFSYLHSIKDKIVGVLITHAHEDHIGAVPYLFKELQFPLYGTPLSLGMIGNKFDEHGLKKFKSFFKIVQKRQPIQIGEFLVEWIHITHSIIDASALAIQTKVGTIIHTGDFKIDHTPVDNIPTDLYRLAHYGEQGVMLLLSDSTNSYKPGITPSESSVGPVFENLFKNAKGRVIMSTFSSNIHRVYQAIQHALNHNRKVAVIGRSMEKNLDIARELGYIHLPSKTFIEAHEVEKHPDHEVFIVTTGSQGETMSALYRMATDEHRHISIKPSDLIIISAKAIPGNEASVSSILNLLMKKDAQVVHHAFDVHVSGHAAQEEQKLMLRLIKPKFFLPVHGEYNHVARHKETAISCGIPEKNIYLMEDGDQVEVNPNFMRKTKSIKSGKSYVDNTNNTSIAEKIVQERQEIASAGLLSAVLFISKEGQDLMPASKLTSLGIVDMQEERAFLKELHGSLSLHIKALRQDTLSNHKYLDENVRNFLRKALFKHTKKYPAIVSHVFVS